MTGKPWKIWLPANPGIKRPPDLTKCHQPCYRIIGGLVLLAIGIRVLVEHGGLGTVLR